MGIGGVALATGIGWIGIVTFQISVFVIKKYYKVKEEGSNYKIIIYHKRYM